PTPTYPLSLHDALPISAASTHCGENRYPLVAADPIHSHPRITDAFIPLVPKVEGASSHTVNAFSAQAHQVTYAGCPGTQYQTQLDRKSTRLNSSHDQIS